MAERTHLFLATQLSYPLPLLPRAGHRDVSDTIPDIMRASPEYQFDDEMESAISVFATLTKRDAKARRALSTLTYEDVYWASKIENPLVRREDTDVRCL